VRNGVLRRRVFAPTILGSRARDTGSAAVAPVDF
jgi:hypothetical protein